MKIIWSIKANYTFYAIRNYLIQYRNYEVGKKFGNEVTHVIHLLSTNPSLGKFRTDLECNEILISKYISLYYIINGNLIHLIRFHNNRQMPLTILTL